MEDIVKMLIEKGANVNATNNKGDTSIHWAAKSGNYLDFLKFCRKYKHFLNFIGQTNVAKILIEYGADVKAENENKFTAMHDASQNGKRHHKLNERDNIVNF